MASLGWRYHLRILYTHSKDQSTQHINHHSTYLNIINNLINIFRHHPRIPTLLQLLFIILTKFIRIQRRLHRRLKPRNLQFLFPFRHRFRSIPHNPHPNLLQKHHNILNKNFKRLTENPCNWNLHKYLSYSSIMKFEGH